MILISNVSQNRRRVGELSCAAISGKGYGRKSLLIGCIVSTICLVLYRAEYLIDIMIIEKQSIPDYNCDVHCSHCL